MNKYLKAFWSGFTNPFGEPTYQELFTLPRGEITRRINAKFAPRRAETVRMLNEFNKFVNKSKMRKKKN